MHFVVDAQLPPGLVRILAEKGHTAEHVFDRFSPHVTDAEIWQYALSCGGVIVSKDEDFPRRALVAEPAPKILWLRVGNTSNRALFAWLSPLWPVIERSLQSGEQLVEVI
jgi:predicted nuclease of predicted toxin-antitoxin system